MLSTQMKENLRAYKYSCRDTSPLAIYVMHPFWDWVTKFYPIWIAPNLLTFLGFLLTVLHFIILTYFNPNFDNPNDIPRFVWLLTAILVFAAHTLDGTDGKQARRTKSSSPLGELFDHGCDSWTVLFLPAVLYTMLGCNTTPTRIFFMQWILTWTFITSHWEKYITGVLILPWSYDAAQLGVTFICLFAFQFGPGPFATPVMFGLSVTNIMEILLVISFFCLHFPFVIHNVRSNCPSGKPWHRGRGYKDAFISLLPLTLLTLTSTAWVYFSPSDLVSRQPRLFIFCVTTIASNTCCELILAQLGGTRAPAANRLVFLYSLLALFICATRTSMWAVYSELPLLILLSCYVTWYHVDCAIRVVTEISEFLNVSVFRLKSHMLHS